MVNHLKTTHYRLGLVCDQCFGCPTVMSDTSAGMDAKIVKDMVLLLEQVHPTNLPTQLGVYTRKQRQCYSTRPPSPWKARRFNEGGAACQSAESIFCSPALPTNSYFYPSCNQDCLREMLLITAKAVSIKIEENNNSNY